MQLIMCKIVKGGFKLVQRVFFFSIIDSRSSVFTFWTVGHMGSQTWHRVWLTVEEDSRVWVDFDFIYTYLPQL